MIETVAAFIRRHDLIRPGDRVLVAVSGGADSTALLHLLAGLRAAWPFDLVAGHLDHGIRPAAEQEARRIAEVCRGLAVPLAAGRVDVPAAARRTRRGLEAAGREERRRFLRRIAEERGCRRIALGHHHDDQAETVLHRLVRGTGPTGLAAMRPASGPFIRPLLGTSRADLRAWLAAERIGWSEDPSNRDPAFTRNRIRHRLLPLLREFNPRVEEALARLGERMAVEEDFWAGLVGEAFAEVARTTAAGLELDVAGLRDRHPALRARLLRHAAGAVRGHLQGIQATHVGALEALLDAGRPQAEAHLPGLWAGRRYATLVLSKTPPEPSTPGRCEISGAGRYSLGDGRWLHVTLDGEPQGESRWSVEFAAEQVRFPLLVRSFLPGDRIRLPGGGRQKLKELLRAAQLPRESRLELPLVVADEILWVPGLRRAAGRRPEAGGTVLRLTLEGTQEYLVNLQGLW